MISFNLVQKPKNENVKVNPGFDYDLVKSRSFVDSSFSLDPGLTSKFGNKTTEEEYKKRPYREINRLANRTIVQ